MKLLKTLVCIQEAKPATFDAMPIRIQDAIKRNNVGYKDALDRFKKMSVYSKKGAIFYVVPDPQVNDVYLIFSYIPKSNEMAASIVYPPKDQKETDKFLKLGDFEDSEDTNVLKIMKKYMPNDMVDYFMNFLKVKDYN